MNWTYPALPSQGHLLDSSHRDPSVPQRAGRLSLPGLRSLPGALSHTPHTHSQVWFHLPLASQPRWFFTPGNLTKLQVRMRSLFHVGSCLCFPFLGTQANWSLHCVFFLGNLLQTHGFDLYAHDLHLYIPIPNLSLEFSSHHLNPTSLPGCPTARILVAGDRKLCLNHKQSRNLLIRITEQPRDNFSFSTAKGMVSF